MKLASVKEEFDKKSEVLRREINCQMIQVESEKVLL